eukprot:scaffold54165_cov46-Phaeocystis_antarctica.AAC.2
MFLAYTRCFLSLASATSYTAPPFLAPTSTLTTTPRCGLAFPSSNSPVVPRGATVRGTCGTPGAGTRTVYVPWRSSCPVPQVRSKRLVRVACTYSTEAPGRTCQHRFSQIEPVLNVRPMAARGSHSATFMLAGLPERSSAERACDTEETYDEEPPTRRPSMVRASGFLQST